MEFKRIRKLSGLTQVEFSLCYNIPLQTLKQWEIGKCKPPDYVLDLLLSEVMRKTKIV